jgi:uridine kinase
MAAHSEARLEMLDRLASLVRQRSAGGTLRVAIDGIDCAGKTTLADELARVLAGARLPVLRASIDGFHNPAQIRHRRRDQDLPRSYYEDSFDYSALRGLLLEPLRADGDHVMRTRVLDFRTDAAVDDPPTRVPRGTVLLFDGVFLLRPELDGYWDLSVFVAIDPATSLQRAITRDVALFGTAAAIVERYQKRYLPGQRLYLSTVRPQERADVLIDNNDPAVPIVLRAPSAREREICHTPLIGW